MISNEQMEKLWWQYKNEGVAKNISLQAFCSMHNVPYNAFEKYLKLRRHFSEVHHITVTDLPTTETDSCDTAPAQPATTPTEDLRAESHSDPEMRDKVRIMPHIRMSNGMELSKRNMNYRELQDLVVKLEALC